MIRVSCARSSFLLAPLSLLFAIGCGSAQPKPGIPRDARRVARVLVLRVILLYMVCVNLLAYGMMWLDTRRAMKGGRRIAESELLMCALAGGSPGAYLAMRRYRHKTKKRWFRVAFFGIVALQLGVAGFLLWFRR